MDLDGIDLAFVAVRTERLLLRPFRPTDVDPVYRACQDPELQRWLTALGLGSLAIYLMNTIAIGVTKGLMLKLFPWDGPNFRVYLPVLTLAGVAVPMAARRLAIRYVPHTARYLA